MGKVALLDREPDLAVGLDAQQLRRARAEAVLETVRVPRGDVDPAAAPRAPALVLGGFLAREVHLAARPAAQLLGPGDVVDLRETAAADLPCEIRWRAHTPLSLAVLGARFERLTVEHPAVAAAVRSRLADQSARALLVAAVVALPRVEQRVVALLWIVAGRWGTMSPEGATVPVTLTHEALGRLAGARRSTVTLALGRLAEHGVLLRRADGHLVLRRGSDQSLETLGPGTSGRSGRARAPRAPRTTSRAGLLAELDAVHRRMGLQGEQLGSTLDARHRASNDARRLLQAADDPAGR